MEDSVGASSSGGRIIKSKNGSVRGGNVTSEFFSAFPISSSGDFKYSARIQFMLEHPKIRSKLEEWVSSTNEEPATTKYSPSLGDFQLPPSTEKDVDFSIRMRELGNSLYTRKPPTSLLLSNALEAYNLSLLFAPPSSPAYHAALANRSAVYLEMSTNSTSQPVDLQSQKLPLQFALEDAQLAFASPNHPETQKPKLTQRILKIQSILENFPETNDSSTQISSSSPVEFTSNPNFANASTYVDLKLSSEASRGRIVTCGQSRNLPKETVVFRESPFASVLLPQFVSSHCSHCHKRLLHLHFFPCSSCSQVKFCSPSCVSSAWKSSHSFECGSLDFLHSVGIAHLALRLLLVAGKSRVLRAPPHNSPSDLSLFHESPSSTSTDEELAGDIAYSRVASLVDHLGDMSEAEDLFQYALSGSLLTLWLLTKTHFFSPPEVENVEIVSSIGGAILRHICQLICNAHAITDLVYADDEFVNVDQKSTKSLLSTSTADSTQERIASAIYPSASMMNHSCDNNVVFGFVEGNKLVVRLSADIPVGGEIFNCYGPHYRRMGVADRQEILRDQYFFDCACRPCRKELKEGVSFVETFEGFKCPNCPEGIVNENSGRCRNCSCQMDPETLQDLLDSANYASKVMEDAEVLLERGKVQEALGMFQKAQEDRETFLHPLHKEIGRGNDLIGKCYAILGNFETSTHHVRLSLHYVATRFGLDSFEYAREAKKLSQLLAKLDEDNKANKDWPKYSEEINLLTQQFTRILSFY